MVSSRSGDPEISGVLESFLLDVGYANMTSVGKLDGVVTLEAPNS